MEELEVASCVRGFHIHKDTWVPVLDEVLQCSRETQNSRDRYAVAVVKNTTVVGHLPSKISKICSLFIRRRGTIDCKITGARRYSVHLLQGGLEIPCRLIFSGNKKDVQKLKIIFHKTAIM